MKLSESRVKANVRMEKYNDEDTRTRNNLRMEKCKNDEDTRTRNNKAVSCAEIDRKIH